MRIGSGGVRIKELPAKVKDGIGKQGRERGPHCSDRI
jgi:hypothetical protein